MKKIIIMLVLSLFLTGCGKFEERNYIGINILTNKNQDDSIEVQNYILAKLKIYYGIEDITIIENSYKEFTGTYKTKYFMIKIKDKKYFVETVIIPEGFWYYEHYEITIRKIN